MVMDADVIVIGGGPAGLAGATTLARARRRVVVVDAGQPRNAKADGVHSYLSRDGTAPGDLLAVGREELASYGGTLVPGTATTARALDDGFDVTLADGSTLTARRLLVTTGAVDELPDVPGLAEQWGSGVVHCPYCHGWEVRDQRIAVLATNLAAVMHAGLLWSQWSDDVTVLLHEQQAPAAEQAALLEARGVRVLAGRVERVVSAEDGRLVGVDVDGSRVDCSALVVPSFVRASSSVLDALGVVPQDFAMAGTVVGTYVAVDAMTGATSVPGVYAAGNITSPAAQVISSAAAGVMAAAQINMALVMADASAAVAS
ncbi:MAG: Thioredoxin reductase [Nocardioidaceae bacterium]|nr:Thioredoxin reductase [Nocardioidaceae bacterium]